MPASNLHWESLDIQSSSVWGFLSGRVWSRWTMLVVIVASGLLSIPMSRPQSLEVLFAIQVVSGFCLGGMGVLPRLMVPRLTDPDSKGKSFGLLGLVFSFGTMAGSLFGGFVYAAVGLSLTFIVAAIVSMLPLVPLVFIPFRTELGSTPTLIPDAGKPERLPAPPLALHEFIILGFVGLTTAACSIFYNLLLPNIITRDLSFSATVFDVSLVIAVFSFSSGAFQPLMALGSSRSPRRWIVAALVACGLTFCLLSFSRSMLEVYFISFLAGVASSAITPLVLVILSGVPQRSLGKVFGLYGAAENSGIILGSSVGGLLWAAWGTTSVFLAMATLFFAASIAYALITRRAVPLVAQ